METYVITNPEATVIYGTVEAVDGAKAAGLIYNGAARWFGPADPEPQALYAMSTLTDGRWREVAPAGPAPHGDCGGEVQVTDSYSRRFALARPDGLWAVITYIWYGINESVEYVTNDTVAEVVEQQIDFQVVDDPHDLDAELWWDDDRSKEYTPAATEEGVRRRAEDFTAGDIDWDGEEWRKS